MSFRTTRGIVSNFEGSAPQIEADVIMAAAALGFATSYIAKDHPIQFDRDPLDVDQKDVTAFNAAVTKIDKAIADYLRKHGLESHNRVHAGTAPGYTRGAVIVGVYTLAGRSAPPSVSAPKTATIPPGSCKTLLKCLTSRRFHLSVPCSLKGRSLPSP
jgi:hypothetical protein